MTDDRKAGIALIAGSLGGLITMAIHPTGGGSLSAEQLVQLATLSAMAHSLAMISFVLMFLGACGLARRLAGDGRVAFAGLVIYALSCVAVMIATAVSGFVVPEIMRHMERDVPAAAPQWRMLIVGIFQINQAFSRIYSVGVSLAIVLWCVSGFLNGGLGRGVSIYGCIVAPLIVAGIVIGRLRLDVHGMTVVALAQAIWFAIAGAQLGLRRRPVADIPA